MSDRRHRDRRQTDQPVPDDRRHGERRTYKSGCHCLPCRAAEAAYRSHLRQLQAKGTVPLHTIISAADAWRLIKAMRTEHFKDADLARSLGHQHPILQIHTRVRLRTFLRLKRLYRLRMQLEGTEPT